MQIREECIKCREAAAVFNMSYFGKFYLVGEDAQAAADWLFTNDVNIKPGRLNMLVYFDNMAALFR